MPKIFEYLGQILFFYSNEHELIHVNVKRGECENTAEFILLDGVITEIIIKDVKGRTSLF